jgi:hypothetical protein
MGSMRYDELFVAAVAIGLGLIAGAIAVGPWTGPYRLRTIELIGHRYGMMTARAVWVALAVTMFSSGLAILNGIRPTYTAPAQNDWDHD